VRSNARPIIVVVDFVAIYLFFLRYIFPLKSGCCCCHLSFFIGKTIENPTIPYPLNKKYFYSQFPLVFPLDFSA
jgi:hypothetical protein